MNIMQATYADMPAPKPATVQRYIGETNADGEPHGQGEMWWSDGAHSKGEYRDGDLVLGTYHHADGTVMKGRWAPPDRAGYRAFDGVTAFHGGNEWNGRIAKVDDRHQAPEGFGTLTTPSGNKFTGRWCDGRPVGELREDYPDGRYRIGAAVDMHDPVTMEVVEGHRATGWFESDWGVGHDGASAPAAMAMYAYWKNGHPTGWARQWREDEHHVHVYDVEWSAAGNPPKMKDGVYPGAMIVRDEHAGPLRAAGCEGHAQPFRYAMRGGKSSGFWMSPWLSLPFEIEDRPRKTRSTLGRAWDAMIAREPDKAEAWFDAVSAAEEHLERRTATNTLRDPAGLREQVRLGEVALAAARAVEATPAGRRWFAAVERAMLDELKARTNGTGKRAGGKARRKSKARRKRR